MVTAVVAGLKVVGLDVGEAVVACMVDGAAADRWVDHVCRLVQALLFEDWDGGAVAEKTQKKKSGFMFQQRAQFRQQQLRPRPYQDLIKNPECLQ